MERRAGQRPPPGGGPSSSDPFAVPGGLDVVPTSTAVVDTDGTIRAVNNAWLEFGRSNGAAHPEDAIGWSYREWTDASDPDACASAAGVFDVIEGRLREFSLSYPCHSPEEQRWFRLLVVPISDRTAPRPVVTVHLRLAPDADRELHQMADLALQPSVAEVTVCAWCASRSRIAGDPWETGLPTRHLGFVSHGICPDCAEAIELAS